jgi:hypothetical protein
VLLSETSGRRAGTFGIISPCWSAAGPSVLVREAWRAGRRAGRMADRSAPKSQPRSCTSFARQRRTMARRQTHEHTIRIPTPARGSVGSSPAHRWQFWWQLNRDPRRPASKGIGCQPAETRPDSPRNRRLLGLVVLALDGTLNQRVAGSIPARPFLNPRESAAPARRHVVLDVEDPHWARFYTALCSGPTPGRMAHGRTDHDTRLVSSRFDFPRLHPSHSVWRFVSSFEPPLDRGTM